jgi:preprotein translocase subunit SecE
VLTQTGVMKKIINYIKDSYNELVFKVSWPSRTELTSSAVIVMIASIMMALVVWGVDSVFDRVVKLFYGLL